MRNLTRRLPLVTAGAFGLLLAASSAYAQSYNENVDVTSPRMHYEPRQSSIGAPIENVSLSEAVRYDDLDLRTAGGARRLEERVRYTAQSVCNRLDHMYPIAEDGSPPCIEGALATGMQRADAAITHVRYLAMREENRQTAMRDTKEKKHTATRETKRHHAA